MGNLYIFCAGASDPEYLPSSIIVENVLINAPNAFSEKDLEKTMKLIRAARPVYKMMDSGGFQILEAEEEGVYTSHNPQKGLVWSKTELNITPKHVVWVASNLKPEIMVALDFPVGKITDPRNRKRNF